MDMESNIGLMGHIMKENGNIIKLRVKEHFYTLKVIFIKDYLRIIWQMGMENIHVLMKVNM